MSPPTLLPGFPWAASAEQVCDLLGLRPEVGLSSEDVERRRALHGPNRLTARRRVAATSVLVRQFRGLVVALLTAAAVAALAFGEVAEASAIAVVIVLNAAIGFATELRAVRSMEALRQIGRATTRVRRGGRALAVAADDLVPGDLVLLEAGDVVAADLRLVEVSRLQANESQLTGESLPVDKETEAVAESAPLPERACLLFRGSSVVRGSGAGVVVASGMATELGRVASLVESAREEVTPLERRLERLARILAGIAVAIGTVTAALGALAGYELFLMIETGIALAVAAIPEALPIVATLTLARGVWRMAQRDALINRLSAVETLGAVTVICTDKTGTLTENRMTVVGIVVDGTATGIDTEEPVVRAALRVGALCSNASLDDRGDGTGDPMEVALLAAAARAGIDREEQLATWPEQREEAFDPTHKMMATVHAGGGGGFLVAVKGAPERVLQVCARIRSREGERRLGARDRLELVERQEVLAAEGYRVLALAEKQAASAADNPYEGLTWLGLALFEDPPRPDVAAALAACRAAGIKVVMVTGDQAATAWTIGQKVGLWSSENDSRGLSGHDLANPPWGEEKRRLLLASRLFSRVDPAQKLELIRLYQGAGEVVAMTGDGVNDAPALRKADVGIAMGRRGSQVAREAADVILRDDSFATIAVAISQGRTIFGNIRRSLVYLFSCNAAEVLVVTSATLLAAPLPLLPLQLLFLNLVTDVFPALALGLGEGNAREMENAPRDPREPLLTSAHWMAIAGYAFALAIVTLGAMFWCLRSGLGGEKAVTAAFFTLALAQLWHVFNMRSRRSPVIVNEVTGNPFIWGALLLSGGLLLIAARVPLLADALRLARLDFGAWQVVMVMSALPLVAAQAVRPLIHRIAFAGASKRSERALVRGDHPSVQWHLPDGRARVSHGSA